MTRFDETWHRLLKWTAGQTPSERLAALVLDEEGYESIDPSHPLGGKDGGADALVKKDGATWVMAVYFPRDQQTIKTITDKLASDIAAAKKKVPGLTGLVFVTNQELRLADRETLRGLDPDIDIDLIHLERLATILDRPRMSPVREQYLDISAGPPPILVSAEVVGVARTFDFSDQVLESLIEIEREDLIKQRDKLIERSKKPQRVQTAMTPGLLEALGLGLSEPHTQPPMSDDEIARRVNTLREELTSRWGQCQDYLAAIAWPALHFEITNQEKSFLNNVQIILTFHGARGLEYAAIDTFKWERLKDPSWEPPAGPFGHVVQNFPRINPAGYPISWDHNEAGDLVVTIDLPELRPHPPWRHNGNDVVLVARDPADTVTVTYTVTAHGYGTYFESDPIALPTEHVDMFDSVQEALRAVDPTND
ncbi:hypothetical protein [Gordonia sp. C13]|uniref:hypothetical protein n=1 Tax=Gordonia sp. C13 TaxID=2935078 RepID=UPI0012B6D1F6|nr:hypothetical protein [Gordonia sp. C13]MCK8616713.1 hypothetical protein [Gordonia sp. C13]